MDPAPVAFDSLSNNESPVYLLKTPSVPSDAYQETLEQATELSLKPIFVPVLEHLFRHDALRAIKRHAERFAFAAGSSATARQTATNNPSKRYGGLVFTSQRAIDAFGDVIARLDSHRLVSLFDAELPIYVVGPATARRARALGLPCPVLGEDTGNGEALSKFIMDYHKSLPEDVTHLNGQKLPLLFLVGEQRRDVIPNSLQSPELSPLDRIPVQEVVVYETGEMTTFEEDITRLFNAAKARGCTEQFAIVFSPQGCEATLNALGWLSEKTNKYETSRRDTASTGGRTSVLAIGPTTRDHLKATFDFEPDAVATQPTPVGVLDAIKSLRA